MTTTLTIPDAEMIACYHAQRKLWKGLDSFLSRNAYRQTKAKIVAGLKERKGVFEFELGTLYLNMFGDGIVTDTEDMRPKPTDTQGFRNWNARIERLKVRNKERCGSCGS